MGSSYGARCRSANPATEESRSRRESKLVSRSRLVPTKCRRQRSHASLRRLVSNLCPHDGRVSSCLDALRPIPWPTCLWLPPAPTLPTRGTKRSRRLAMVASRIGLDDLEIETLSDRDIGRETLPPITPNE